MKQGRILNAVNASEFMEAISEPDLQRFINCVYSQFIHQAHDLGNWPDGEFDLDYCLKLIYSIISDRRCIKTIEFVPTPEDPYSW